MKNHLTSLKRFTTSSNHRELNHVLVQNGRAYATDSYAMLQVATTSPDGIYDAKTGDLVRPRNQFDLNLEAVTALDKNVKPQVTVTLNARFLLKMAQAFRNSELDTGLHNIALDIYDERRPVVFRSKDKSGAEMVGMIMPIRK